MEEVTAMNRVKSYFSSFWRRVIYLNAVKGYRPKRNVSRRDIFPIIATLLFAAFLIYIINKLFIIK